MPFVNYLLPAALGSAAGFVKPLWFISTGYGAAMLLQGVAALASGRAAGADGLGRLHLAAVAAYGARLAGFVLWRTSLPSYQKRRQEQDAKVAGMALGKKLGLWVGVSPLYWAMFAPAFFNSAAGPGAGASPALTALSTWVGAPLMLAALVWEAVADHQQQMHEEKQAGAAERKPCMTGLWRLSQQANYFGEGLFWLAGYVTAARAYTSVGQALGVSVGVAAILSIMWPVCKRRAKQRAQRYKQVPEFQRWQRETAPVVPFVPWGLGTRPAEGDDKPEGRQL